MPELVVNLSKVDILTPVVCGVRWLSLVQPFLIEIGRESLQDFDKTVGNSSMIKKTPSFVWIPFFGIQKNTIVVHNQNRIS